jgi:hypothetical protein
MVRRFLSRLAITHGRSNGRLTLPLSGRQEAFAIEADSMAACPLEGFVRRASCAAPCPSQTMAAHGNQLWILH